MNISAFSYADRRPGWSVDSLILKEGINLLVGASGSGKTRILNMLFNIGTFAASNRSVALGAWTLQFTHSGTEYTWKFEGTTSEEREPRVVSEELWIGTQANLTREIFSRTEAGFRFGEKDVPKLSKESSGIYLFREEEIIKPVHEALSRIMRRRFWSEDLSNAVALQSIPHQLIRKLDKRERPASLNDLYSAQLSLHLLLYLLDRYFKRELELVNDQFTRVFPFVEGVEIRRATDVLDMPLGDDYPVAVIKERGIRRPIPVQEIASGMQKVLLIIADVVTAPGDLLYMIDEYENSLGVNAIDFLPPFLAEYGGARQFLITSHHPLLINAIPMSDWLIFHRKGLNIRVTRGRDLEARYGSSKQQRFVQLINDPLYREGVE